MTTVRPTFTIEIMSAEFLTGARHAFKASIPQAKLGWLDEAVAAGLGFRTKASLLAALRASSAGIIVRTDEDRFLKRLAEFGVEVGAEPFRWVAPLVRAYATNRSAFWLDEQGRRANLDIDSDDEFDHTVPDAARRRPAGIRTVVHQEDLAHLSDEEWAEHMEQMEADGFEPKDAVLLQIERDMDGIPR